MGIGVYGAGLRGVNPTPFKCTMSYSNALAGNLRWKILSPCAKTAIANIMPVIINRPYRKRKGADGGEPCCTGFCVCLATP